MSYSVVDKERTTKSRTEGLEGDGLQLTPVEREHNMNKQNDDKSRESCKSRGQPANIADPKDPLPKVAGINGSKPWYICPCQVLQIQPEVIIDSAAVPTESRAQSQCPRTKENVWWFTTQQSEPSAILRLLLLLLSLNRRLWAHAGCTTMARLLCPPPDREHPLGLRG